ncbi:MAG: DUF2937 family protein [Pseudomonadota bacterium]
MIRGVLTLVFGLSGAAGLSQFPEFSQQYLQRLAGAVQVLEEDVAEFDADAAALAMDRGGMLDALSQTEAGSLRADTMGRKIDRFETLSANLSALRDAGPFARLAQAPRFTDPDLAAGALEDFKPAVPLTAEGAGFAAIGFALGWALLGALWALLVWPIRRLRRRRAASRAPEAAPTVDAKVEPFGDDAEDLPFVTYGGDIHAVVDVPVPPLKLMAHDGSELDLAMLTAACVIYTYPLLGRPGTAFPDGWDEVEDAADSTAMACSFRDAFDMIKAAGLRDVIAISTQDSADQKEAHHRLALPFTLASDPGAALLDQLDLPHFVLNEEPYFAPTIMIVQNGRIAAAMHPIKDPALAAPRLLDRLAQARAQHRKAQSA